MGKTTTQWAEDMLDGIGDELDTIRANVRALVEALAAKEAELEAVQRWRVTAEELPPERVPVVGYGGVSYQDPITVMLVEGEWYAAFHQKAWMAGIDGVNRAPEYWMPIPAAPVAPSQGANNGRP